MVGDPEDHRVGQVAAEGVLRLLEADLPGLGGREVLPETEGLDARGRARAGAGHATFRPEGGDHTRSRYVGGCLRRNKTNSQLLSGLLKK